MKKLTDDILHLLHDGTVIPAHPLALNKDRKLDVMRQRALTNYYMDAGAGGIAVGVHTTQFQIREAEYSLLEPVLSLAAETVNQAKLDRPFIKVAGICGPLQQAIQEAELAAKLGYEMGLLSMGGLNDWSDEELLERTEVIAGILPVFGFYLQPSVGGRVLSYSFWERFVEIPNVMAIKMAPFNRYQTLDVVRAVCSSTRSHEIALYTGNDDNIIADLLTTYQFMTNGKIVKKNISGGLLGHWSVWTKSAVEQLDEIKKLRKEQDGNIAEWLTKGIEVTDANAAFFDSANSFHGCIAGLHEVLRRQGLLEGRWCLDEQEEVSPGQLEEIDRIYSSYPHLSDDAFVKENLSKWLQPLRQL
jgi:hypothetical protein